MNKKTLRNAPRTLERAPKAYKNIEFLSSKEARIIRILAEYLYPEQKFRHIPMLGTITIFGSARIRSQEDLHALEQRLKQQLASAHGVERRRIEMELDRIERQRHFTQYYTDAVSLAERITEWSLTLPQNKRLLVCSGGGPGIMEAANRGAYNAGGESIGFNISLPFEQFPNPYISPELNFEFHYFFIRKFWFMNLAKALIVFPGGFGTMDELFELLTLVQTQKITKQLPIMLYGREFWKNTLNFEYLAETGMISEEDIMLFHYADDPDEAFTYLRQELSRIYNLE
ncbi:MAG: TIGR00730 family Rossman fold protein [Bacteroidota bacterium]|nr:TIGR00730 family Rossman fold protein [Candidatus Kapabacteria bacterium]MDW8219869.1 TIGR00730 family Rossman fold protein [Bacteroidota bacterium]